MLLLTGAKYKLATGGVWETTTCKLQPSQIHPEGLWFESMWGCMSWRKFKPVQVRWGEKLGKPECPYMRRWVLILGPISVRLHQWYRSDDKRYMHDHAWHFLAIVLRGSYTDVSPDRRQKMTPWRPVFRKASHQHYVDVPEGGCLTLLLTGPKIRKWGFWVSGVHRQPLMFFRKFGHPACDEQ